MFIENALCFNCYSRPTPTFAGDLSFTRYEWQNQKSDNSQFPIILMVVKTFLEQWLLWSRCLELDKKKRPEVWKNPPGREQQKLHVNYLRAQVNFRQLRAETAGNRYLRRFLPASAGIFTCGSVYLRPSQVILHASVLQCNWFFDISGFGMLSHIRTLIGRKEDWVMTSSDNQTHLQRKLAAEYQAVIRDRNFFTRRRIFDRKQLLFSNAFSCFHTQISSQQLLPTSKSQLATIYLEKITPRQQNHWFCSWFWTTDRLKLSEIAFSTNLCRYSSWSPSCTMGLISWRNISIDLFNL